MAMQNHALEAYDLILKALPTFKKSLLDLGDDVSGIFTLIDAVSASCDVLNFLQLPKPPDQQLNPKCSPDRHAKS
jgi:hypothetical protein